MKKFLLVGGSLFFTISCFAQQPCIREARGVYDDGRLHELPALLEDCINGSNFSKQEKVEAYRLLTLSYIYSDEPEKADEAMLSLLKSDPEFVLNEAVEPDEFIALYKTFRTDPIFRFGVKLGVNASRPSAISANTTNDQNDPSARSHYETQFSFRSALSVEIPLNKSFTLNPELVFSINSFNTITPQYQDNSSIDARETQAYFELPVLLQYSIINKPKFKTYISAGPVPAFMSTAETTIDRAITDEASASARGLDIIDLRNRINLSAGLAAGVKVKIGPGFYIFEVRYNHGFTNLSKQDQAFLPLGNDADQSLVWDTRYADSEFKLNTFTINVFGYVFNQYKPKKLR